MEPTPERFRRLARSAPYRWRSLVLEGTWGHRMLSAPGAAADPRVSAPDDAEELRSRNLSAPSDALRLRVERPDRIRVERSDGSVLEDLRQGSLGSGSTLTADGRHVPWVPPPAPAPELDEDGLATALRRPWDEGPEVPYYENYFFVAVLDPYELSHGVDVLELRAVEHGGRPAWEALLRPTAAYEPRCACCPLMRTRDTDLMEGLEPLPAYADAHRVRLDVGTGVCVSTREVGGPADGHGHNLVLLEVAP